MAENLALFALFCAAAWFVSHVVRGYMGASSPPQRPPTKHDGQAPAAPQAYLARWMVRYVDGEGVVTTRVIRIIQVKPRLRQFVVWCELRNDRRTFAFGGLQSITDAQTNAPVDLPTWLDAYREARRRK